MMLIPFEVPNPQDEHSPAQFRLPGFGGAAVFLRSQIVPARTFETSGPALAFDVMLLAPHYHVWYMTRPTEPDFVDRLAGFLFAAANDFHPEQSLATFSDTAMGLTIAVLSSTDDRVGLEATVLADPAADLPEPYDLNFETSRFTLATAASAVRCLDHSWPVIDTHDVDLAIGNELDEEDPS